MHDNKSQPGTQPVGIDQRVAAVVRYVEPVDVQTAEGAQPDVVNRNGGLQLAGDQTDGLLYGKVLHRLHVQQQRYRQRQHQQHDQAPGQRFSQYFYNFAHTYETVGRPPGRTAADQSAILRIFGEIAGVPHAILADRPFRRTDFLTFAFWKRFLLHRILSYWVSSRPVTTPRPPCCAVRRCSPMSSPRRPCTCSTAV